MTAARPLFHRPTIHTLLHCRGMLALVAVAVLLVASGADGPAQPDKSDKPAAKPGKLTLFDGKSLDGWKRTNFGGEGEVDVEEGTILLRRGAR